MAFKDMLKYFRERAGLSQGELAKSLGLSTSTISMYEVGRREPNFEIEEKIADFFNTDLNTLRGNDIEPRYSNDYYLDPETRELAELLHSDSNYRILFDAAKDSRPEDLQRAADLLQRLKGTNPNG